MLSNPIFRGIIQIIGCAAVSLSGPAGWAACGAIAGALTLGSGGSITDALKAFAFSFASAGIFSAVGPSLNAIVGANGLGGAVFKAAVHGVIGGALSVAQGGNFLQGFAGSAIGAIGGYLASGSGLVPGRYGDGVLENQIARALISGAAGCAGAVLSGGKCAQAAVTAAFGSLYNGESSPHIDERSPFTAGKAKSDQEAYQYLLKQTEPDPDSWRAHNYTVIGDKEFPSFRSALEELHRSPGPGSNYPNGVYSGNTTDLPFFGAIRTYVNYDTGTIFNVTTDRHLLDPGFVMRFPVQNPSGNWQIFSIGRGSGLPYFATGLGARWTWQGR